MRGRTGGEGIEVPRRSFLMWAIVAGLQALLFGVAFLLALLFSGKEEW